VHFPEWLTGTGRRWYAVISTIGTLGSVAAFAVSRLQFCAWLAMAFLFSWVVALFWTAHNEHKAEVDSERLSLVGEVEAKGS
jgi:hypothetical protein